MHEKVIDLRRYILLCIGTKEAVVHGMVPLKLHRISVIAVYLDGIEQRGHIEYTHTGMSLLNSNQGLYTWLPTIMYLRSSSYSYASICQSISPWYNCALEL